MFSSTVLQPEFGYLKIYQFLKKFYLIQIVMIIKLNQNYLITKLMEKKKLYFLLKMKKINYLVII